MLPKLFGTYKNKQFNYTPLYYNQQKEELAERVKRIESELKGEGSGGEFQPGIMRGSFKHLRSMRNKTHRVSNIRLLIIILVLMLIVYYLFNM